MVITFAGQKGGVGKSTLSFLTAAVLSQADLRVAVKDEDPQQSLATLITKLREAKKTQIEVLTDGNYSDYDFVVVDTQPRLASKVLGAAIRQTDRLILPVQPSMLDIEATTDAIELVKQYLRDDAKAFVVWNRVRPGTKISKELESLSKMLELPPLKITVPERVSFSYVPIEGFAALSASDREIIQQLVLAITASTASKKASK